MEQERSGVEVTIYTFISRVEGWVRCMESLVRHFGSRFRHLLSLFAIAHGVTGLFLAADRVVFFHPSGVGSSERPGHERAVLVD